MLRPDWPAQCLVCQGEGLFGLHLEGLCVSGRGGGGETKNRQVRREFIFQRLRRVGSAAQTSPSRRAGLAGLAGDCGVSVCLCVLGWFLGKREVKVIRCRWWGNVTRFSFGCSPSVVRCTARTSTTHSLDVLAWVSNPLGSP